MIGANEWRAAGAALDVSAQPGFTRPYGLAVDAGSGSVQVQFQDATAAWVVAAVYAVDGLQRLDLSNLPAVRIVAIGDAKFKLVENL